MKTVIVLLVLFVLLGCGRTPIAQPSASQDQPPPVSTVVTHEVKLREVEEKAVQISVGMKRSEVELLFQRKDGGFQTPDVSRYYEHPEVIIEIPFDQAGGSWNENNRVKGPPKIYRGLEAMD